MANDLVLTDIDFKEPNAALGAIMAGQSGRLDAFLLTVATDVKNLYQGHVAKRTGQLAASAHAEVIAGGGHDHDRLVGSVTVGGVGAVAEWHSVRNPNPGDEFYYGVLHDLGSPTKDRFQAAKDLFDVTHAYAAVKGHA